MTPDARERVVDALLLGVEARARFMLDKIDTLTTGNVAHTAGSLRSDCNDLGASCARAREALQANNASGPAQAWDAWSVGDRFRFLHHASEPDRVYEIRSLSEFGDIDTYVCVADIGKPWALVYGGASDPDCCVVTPIRVGPPSPTPPRAVLEAVAGEAVEAERRAIVHYLREMCGRDSMLNESAQGLAQAVARSIETGCKALDAARAVAAGGKEAT